LPLPETLPEALDDATIAAMMNPGMSSWAALGRAQFAPGESVLILGATGVAGQLAVQVARRLGARRIVAAGRNPEVLEELKHQGADAVSLNQGREALVSSFCSEFAKGGIDVVLDYVWGNPAESVLEAISQKGLRHAASRIRFVQVGASAAPTIALPAATLRSNGLDLVGSGFGSVSIEKIFEAIADFLREAAKEPFLIKISAAPLRDVEALWNAPEQGPRLVFQP
jgi:NADPH2:quinone reductase